MDGRAPAMIDLAAFSRVVVDRRLGGTACTCSTHGRGWADQLWEKYDMRRGGTDLPIERYPSVPVPVHGWIIATVAVRGAFAFAEPPTGWCPARRTRRSR